MDDKHLGTELKAAIGDLRQLASQLVDTSRDWWQQRRIEMNRNYGQYQNRQQQDNERNRREERGYGEGYGTQHAGTRESRAWDESDFAERGSEQPYGSRYQDEYGQSAGRQYASRSSEGPTYRGFDEAEFYSGRGNHASGRGGSERGSHSPYRDESLGGARFGGGYGSSGYGSGYPYGYGSGYREGAGMAQGDVFGDNYGSRSRSEERGLTGNTGYSQGRSGSPWYTEQDIGQRPQGGYAQHEYGTGSSTYGQMGQGYAGQNRTGQYGQGHYGSAQGQHGLSSQGQSYGQASGYGMQGQYGENRYGYGATGSQGFRGRGPRDYRRSDERITEDLNERLTDDDSLDASSITVRVVDGVATLSGTVESRWMKHRAEDIADGCSGIKDVHNEIRVVSDRQQSGQSQSAGSQTGYSQSSGQSASGQSSTQYGQSSGSTGQDGKSSSSTPPTPTSTTGSRSGGNIAH